LSKSFSGKSVLITGAGGGIGRHLVDGFLENGARVIGADLATESLDALSKEYATKALETIELDISDSHACDAVAKEFGHIDILINNAAASMGLIRDDHLNRLVSLDEITPDIWDHFVTTNLSGAWYMTRAVVPSMRQAHVSPLRTYEGGIRGDVCWASRRIRGLRYYRKRGRAWRSYRYPYGPRGYRYGP
jgi:NAD(P)-dependent dehydrogenase (short-subunit alcohol dehydrogenase family)